MRILLTGNEGYVGVGLQKYFEERGHHVVGWSRKQDILNLKNSDLIREKIDLVVNAAAAMGRAVSTYQAGGLDEKVNFLGVRHLVAELKTTQIPLIHISTKDIYGSVYAPHDLTDEGSKLMPNRLIEDHQLFNPSTLYAMTKLMGEFALSEYSHANAIRLSSGYTDFYHRRGNWMSAFIQKYLNDEAVTLSGDGKQVRDPLHVYDLGRLILKMFETHKWGYKVNAGGGLLNAISILEFAQLVSPDMKINFQGSGDTGFISSNTRARNEFGWEPEINVRQRVPLLIENIKRKTER
ncbi:MAG: NAD-dependent epimerase/dehydratase family protein [Pseudobdellovibrio sp.]